MQLQQRIFYLTEKNIVKQFVLIFILSIFGKYLTAQTIDSIYVNLYTDSLKKGTYNYINIDGLTKDKRFLPLDSTDISFSASIGSFEGNSLWIDADCKAEKVSIKVILKSNPSVYKIFDIYIKQKPNDEVLKTTEEILNDTRKKKKET